LVTGAHSSRKFEELGVVHAVDGGGNEVPHAVDAGIFLPQLFNGGWAFGATLSCGITVVKDLEAYYTNKGQSNLKTLQKGQGSHQSRNK